MNNHLKLLSGPSQMPPHQYAQAPSAALTDRPGRYFFPLPPPSCRLLFSPDDIDPHPRMRAGFEGCSRQNRLSRDWKFFPSFPLWIRAFGFEHHEEKQFNLPCGSTAPTATITGGGLAAAPSRSALLAKKKREREREVRLYTSYSLFVNEASVLGHGDRPSPRIKMAAQQQSQLGRGGATQQSEARERSCLSSVEVYVAGW